MKNICIIIFSVCTVCVVISGCRKKLSPDQYKSWVENPSNGYNKKVFNKNVEMQCLFQPRDYAAARLYFNNMDSYKGLDDAKKELGDHSYFLLKLSAKPEKMEEILTYVYFDLEKDLKLILRGDTLRPSYYLAEPYNGVTPYQVVTVGFPVLLDNKKDFSFRMDSNSIYYQHINISYADRNTDYPRIKI